MGRAVIFGLIVCASVNVANAEGRLLKTLDVKLDRAWTPTGLQVKQGDTLTLVARGRVTSSSLTVGPEGATGTKALNDPEASYPMAGAKPLVVIGRVGDGEPFVIGARVTIVAKADGALSVGINDDQFGDNRGALTVSVFAGSDAGAVEDAAPFDGSTWRLCSGTQENVQFAVGGDVKMETTDCGKAKWKRDGSKVTFTCAATSYEATITGDEMTGESWTAKAKKRDTLCLRRGLLIAPKPKGATTQGVAKDARNSATRTDPTGAGPTVQSLREGKCPAGTHSYLGKCASCPAGTSWKPNGTCRGPCPSGLTEWNDSCWSCPAGMDWVGDGWCRRPCSAGEITWADGCYTCPAGTTWAGDGWCKNTN